MNRADRRRFSLKERKGMAAASVCIANYIRELNENKELTDETLVKINSDFGLIWGAICNRYPNIKKDHFTEEWLVEKADKEVIALRSQKLAKTYLVPKSRPYIKPKGAGNE